MNRSSDRKTVQSASLPSPSQVAHICSSRNKDGTVPHPPHLQHNRPPVRGSPVVATGEPGGGAPTIGTGTGIGRELVLEGESKE